MSSEQVLPLAVGHRGFNSILKQPTFVKERISQIVEGYATGPDTPFDGSLHPALQPPTDLALVRAGTETVVKVSANSGTAQHGGKVTINPKKPALPPPPENVDAEEKRFKDLIREYEATAKPKYKTGVDPDDSHSVPQLWKTIDDAVAKYQVDDVKGVWGRIRLAFRKLGDKSDAVEGWLGLLPHESHYLSVVCGGLKLVLHAAARMRKVAQMVLDKLAEIPAIYASTRRVLHLFADAPGMQTQSKALYTAMLTGIGHMIEYLQRKQGRKTFKAFFAQDDFEARLVEKIDDIAARRDAFNDEVEMCHKEALNELREVTDSNAKTSQASDDAIMKKIQTLQRILTASDAQRKQLQDFLVLAAKENSQLRAEVGNLAAQVAAQTIAFNSIKHLLQDNRLVITAGWSDRKRLDAPEDVPMLPPARPQRRDSVLSIMTAKARSTTTSTIKPAQHRQILLSRLDYDPDVVARDVETNYRLGSDLSLPAQDRSLHVIKSQELSAWVSATHSVALVINGSESVKPKSALSFVCARLVYVLDQMDATRGSASIIPLCFFCGQHLRAKEGWESPAGVVNSLLAQLLTQCKDVDLSKVSKSIKGADSTDVEGVFRLFKKMLGLVPATSVVFCVVDALSFYLDDRETAADAKFLAAELLRLAGRKVARKGPVLKLLLTAPRRLRVKEEDVEYERVTVLELPQTLPNMGGFTAAKWTVGVGGQLQRLGRAR